MRSGAAIDLDEELLNRCPVLSVNGDRAQTQRIHRMQREAQTLEGLLKKGERAAQQNAQWLLESLFVASPCARDLQLPDGLPRMRRNRANTWR